MFVNTCFTLRNYLLAESYYCYALGSSWQISLLKLEKSLLNADFVANANMNCRTLVFQRFFS